MMTIIVTDAQDPLRLTQAELRRWEEQYERAFSMYFGKPPSLEEFIRSNSGLNNNKLSDLEAKYQSHNQ